MNLLLEKFQLNYENTNISIEAKIELPYFTNFHSKFHLNAKL